MRFEGRSGHASKFWMLKGGTGSGKACRGGGMSGTKSRVQRRDHKSSGR